MTATQTISRERLEDLKRRISMWGHGAGYTPEEVYALIENALAELEACTVSVKLPDCDYGAVQHMSGGSDDYCKGFVDGTQNSIKRVKADCAAAGIKLEVGE